MSGNKPRTQGTPQGGAKARERKQEHHIASLLQSRDFWHYHRSQLPDADRILRQIGWDTSRLKDYVLSDIQVQTTWGNTRLPFLAQSPWQVVPGDETRKARLAAGDYSANLAALDMHGILEQMMDAVALGYSVAEIIWRPEGSHWVIADLVPKPSAWFRFSTDGDLLFLSRDSQDGQLMSAEHFLVLRHRASYDNPYGDKLFSKLYWPVLFKRHGLEWWVKFIERFGSLSYFGKYEPTATERQQSDLLQALQDLLSSSVAIGPEGTEIVPVGDQQRWQGSAVHKGFGDWLDKAIAKAVLGQHLSSDSGERGTQALGNVQYKVLETMGRSDQRLIASAFNDLACLFGGFNYGADVAAPIFQFEQPDDLKKERAERDEKLYAIGWRPQAEYIEQHYGIPAEQFTLADPGQGAAAAFDAHGSLNYPHGSRSTFAAAPASGDPPKNIEEEFARQLEGQGQETLDDIQDDYFSALEKHNSFEGALNALKTSHQQQGKQRRKLAGVIDELRHVSRNSGAQDTANKIGANNATHR